MRQEMTIRTATRGKQNKEKKEKKKERVNGVRAVDRTSGWKSEQWSVCKAQRSRIYVRSRASSFSDKSSSGASRPATDAIRSSCIRLSLRFVAASLLSISGWAAQMPFRFASTVVASHGAGEVSSVVGRILSLDCLVDGTKMMCIALLCAFGCGAATS